MSLMAEPVKAKPTSMPGDGYPLLEVSTNSKINNNTPSTQELLLDNSAYFPFQNMNYGTNMNLSANPNASLCFTPTSTSSHVMSDPNSCIIFQNTTTNVKPTVSISSGDIDVIQVHNWETSNFKNSNNNNTNKSNGSINSTNIQLQNSTNFLDNITWGKDSHHSVPLQAEQEEMKWSEYLNTPFLMQNQNHQNYQSIYSEVKPETGFITDESCSSWNHNQQQHTPAGFQFSDIYSKDLQRFSVAFGQTL